MHNINWHLISTFSNLQAVAGGSTKKKKKRIANRERTGCGESQRRCQRRGETNTKKTERERQIQMKQTERKPDKTLADKQREQAGVTATFGRRNRAE